MITLRRATERRHERHPEEEAWLAFHPRDGAGALADGFGTLESLKEGHLPPRAGTRQPRRDAEILTYVLKGTLAYEDSLGQTGVIRAGEFQRMTAGHGVHYSETNASSTQWAHAFQIWLRPSGPCLEPGHEQKRFSTAERRGLLRVVASPDARGNSLRVHQDALLYSAILDRGQHIIHELSQDRVAWLHVVHGAITLGEATLTTGDGAGVTAERAVSLTANQETEVLLLDLGVLPSSPIPSSWNA